MRKLLLLAVTATAFLTVRAGGLMTNTNYHIAFDRMMARGATFDIDATFSNPMGARRMGTLAQLPETVATSRHQTR